MNYLAVGRRKGRRAAKDGSQGHKVKHSCLLPQQPVNVKRSLIWMLVVETKVSNEVLYKYYYNSNIIVDIIVS